MDGILLIDKNSDITSRKTCDFISKKFNEKRVGHIGTLDPFATGLLIVMLGKGNKCAQFLDDATKRYEATIKLGEKTDSLDTEGEVILKKDIPNLTKEKIIEVLNSFLGKQKQTPPMTSAVHVNGKKLYEYARKGVEVDRPSRDIEIKEIELIDFKEDEITFEALVSKGTYIRVLGSDIAERLGTVGHLKALRRIEIASFNVNKAIKMEDTKEENVISIFDFLKEEARVHEVDEELENKIKNGLRKYLPLSYKDKYVLIVNKNKDVIAMYKQINDNKYEFTRGLF